MPVVRVQDAVVALAVAVGASASPSEQAEREQKDPPAKPVEEAHEEQPAPVTFADAVRNDETESVSASAENLVSPSAETQYEEVSSLEDGPGGEEAMGKEAKGKGGKSTWHQIRSGPPSASSDSVEAAKQANEPKTMAAAASADGATDASSIASIVDSVLADLRPKIVEEIAKQLDQDVELIRVRLNAVVMKVRSRIIRRMLELSREMSSGRL